MNIPDLPLWGWILVVMLSGLALTLPFWMLIRLPYMRRIRAKAASSGRESTFFIYFLASVSYLILVLSLIHI